jgi:hypothetical protein
MQPSICPLVLPTAKSSTHTLSNTSPPAPHPPPQVCIPYRKKPSKFKSAVEGYEAAMSFGPDSCPGSDGADNFFNFMSYVDPECMFFFTQGQIARLQAETNKNRPKLWANSLKKA